MTTKITICIPTRNNPIGLAALIGSLWMAEDIDLEPLTLCIADASDLPILANPQLARMLAKFDLRYTHTLAPDVNRQRIGMLQALPPDQPVILADDDLVFADSPYSAMEEFDIYVKEGHNDFVCMFGTKIDCYNDRGYKNFSRHSDRPTNHHYFRMGNSEPIVESKEMVDTFQCDIGLCMGFPGRMLPAYLEMMAHGPSNEAPGIVDDAAAQRWGQAKPLINRRLCADHVGNPNGNWNTQAQKLAAVKMLLEAR